MMSRELRRWSFLGVSRVLVLGPLVALALCLSVVCLAGCSLTDVTVSSGEEEQVDMTASSPRYEVGVPIELTGEPWRPEPVVQWPWLGTMRFTVSRPVIYENAEAAGIELSTQSYPGWKIVAVDITIENIDAECPPEDVERNGAPSILLTMFRMFCETGDLDASSVGFLAPPVDDGFIYPGNAYTWVEPGSSATVRIGYVVIGKRVFGETVGGVMGEEYDAASTDVDLSLLITGGWEYGAPVVELGTPVLASETG